MISDEKFEEKYSAKRGAMRSRVMLTQARDFSGLTWGTISPTDLDLLLDFQDKIFIIAEAKFNGKPLDDGQEKALVRLCDACHATRPTVLLVCSHQTSSSGVIDFAATTVTRYRYEGKWHVPRKATTCRQAIDSILQKLT